MLSLTNEVLFTKAEKVTSLEGLDVIFEEMKQLMYAHNGVGLAAPQVGISKRFFIFTRNNEEVQMCINPQIKELTRGIYVSHEGCLSHPGEIRDIIRYPAIGACWYDLAGNFYHQFLSDREAIIFQHEMDHLNGKTILKDEPILS